MLKIFLNALSLIVSLTVGSGAMASLAVAEDSHTHTPSVCSQQDPAVCAHLWAYRRP